MTMRVRLLSLAAAALVGGVASAQTSAPAPPRPAATPRPARPPAAARGTVSATLNGKTVASDYGRPGLNGRQVDDLIAQLPPGRVWRAGASGVTTLRSEGDVLIGGRSGPAA